MMNDWESRLWRTLQFNFKRDEMDSHFWSMYRPSKIHPKIRCFKLYTTHTPTRSQVLKILGQQGGLGQINIYSSLNEINLVKLYKLIIAKTSAI